MVLMIVIKPKHLVHFLVGSLFLAGLSIATVLLQAPSAYAGCNIGDRLDPFNHKCPVVGPERNYCEGSGCGSRDFGNAIQRPSISGIYRGVNVWGVLRVTSFNSGGNPLTFSADDNNENQYFTHFTNGTLVSVKAEELIWNITTRRTNRSTGCTTMMSGTLTQRSNNTARAVYTSTDGRCDLPTNFSSVTELRKN
jgi:hypothetical protein